MATSAMASTYVLIVQLNSTMLLRMNLVSETFSAEKSLSNQTKG